MTIFSLIIFLISIILGYFYSHRAAWSMIIIFPLFSPMNLAIVPDPLLFLNIDRVAFAIALGIHLKNWNSIKLKLLLKNKFIKIFLIFSLYVVIISFSDRIKNIIFTYIPQIYLVLVLGYYVIKTEDDFNKVVKIFAWQGAFFGIIILMQFFNIYDLPKELRLLLPTPDLDTFQTNISRYGLLRVSGSDGNSGPSGFRLVFYIFISLLYIQMKLTVFRFPPLLFCTVGIFFLMTRAAYVGLFGGFIYFAIASLITTFNHLMKYIKSLFKVISISFILFGALLLIPSVNKIVFTFSEYIKSDESNIEIQKKIARFDPAFKAFNEKPIFGHGSPEYVYYVIMGTDDLPAPFIYAIAGGIPLLILFVLFVFYMPYTFYTYAKLKFSNVIIKIELLIISTSFLAGLIPLFSVWSDPHLIVMILFYVMAYKYILIKYSLFNIVQRNRY